MRKDVIPTHARSRLTTLRAVQIVDLGLVIFLPPRLLRRQRQ